MYTGTTARLSTPHGPPTFAAIAGAAPRCPCMSDFDTGAAGRGTRRVPGAPTSVVGPGRPLRPTLPSEVEAIPPDDKSGDVLPSGASSRSTSLDPRTHSFVPTPDRNVESARSTSPPLNSPARVRMLHTALTSAFRLIGDARVALVKGVRHGGHADQRT